MIKIFGIPFIEYQLKYLDKYKVSSVILCTGHFSEQIEKYIKNVKHRFKFEIIISKEIKKLGTGGAIKNASLYLNDFFCVMYGDSYLDININLIYKNSIKRDKSLITVFKNNDDFYQNNIIIKNNRVIEYSKNDILKKKFYIDYGFLILKKNDFYLFSKSETSFDLSKIINSLIREKKISLYKSKRKFYEIGSHYGINNLKRYFKK